MTNLNETSLPIHDGTLHFRTCELGPTQGSPLIVGAGLLQTRSLILRLSPQVCEHALHEDQGLQFPFSVNQSQY